jgi:uncharacterized protein YukE
MKRFSNSILSISMLVLFTLLLVSCGPKKAEIEPLKVAAKAFQPTMMNLKKILTEGNIAAAKDTLALLTEKFAAIEAAEIPARLTENSEKIQSQVAALATSLDELTSALTQPELAAIDSSLLEKFKTVNTNFARLGGSLKVKIPELISFHDVLHTLWHDYYPNDQIDSIKTLVPEFKEKSTALNAIQWPDVLAGDADQLNQKIKDLQQSVEDLEAACQGDDAEAIKKASEIVHEKYAAINKML